MQYDANNKEMDKKKIHASYTLEGTVLENVESIKYLGVTSTNDLRRNTHVSNICTKANRTLGFLRRNLYTCPQEVKEAAYKGLAADLFLFCYERDFMKSLSPENQADIIEAFNSSSRYLDDLLNIDNIYFEQMVSRI